VTRTKRSAWTLAAGATFSVASALTAVIASPYLLRWLGADQFGAYRTLIDWFAVIAFLDFGVGGALMAALAQRIGRGDGQATSRVLAAGVRAYVRVAAIQVAAGLALVLAMPQVLPVPTLSAGTLRLAVAIGLLPLLLTPLLAFRALAEARQRGYLTWMLLTAQLLFTTALALTFARAGWGLIGLCAALAVAQVPTLLVLAWDGRRAYPPTHAAQPTAEDRQSLRTLSGPTFLHSLTDRLGLASDNMIVAWMLGPAAVAPFFLTQQLAMLAQAQLRGLSGATWAGLADLAARGHTPVLEKRLCELTGLVSSLGVAVLVPIAVYNRPFVTLWVGTDSYAGSLVTMLSCLNAWLLPLFALWGWVLLGTGHIRRWVPFAIAATTLNVVVSVAGTARLGVAGPLLGTAVANVAVSSWALPQVLERTFGTPARRLWHRALTPCRWGLPGALVTWAAATWAPPRTWASLVVMCGTSVAVLLLCWWRIELGVESRREWQQRLRDTLPAWAHR